VIFGHAVNSVSCDWLIAPQHRAGNVEVDIIGAWVNIVEVLLKRHLR
jgi:hypothetical protein